jgi:hypothetical protein
VHDPNAAVLAHKVIDGHPKNHENALVGLAIIARRLEEEKVVAMMELISRELST